MYYFLNNLSFIDLCYTSVISPKILVNFISEKNFTFFYGCMTQPSFFCLFGIDDSYMLTAMAYDHYVAICNPLFYNVTMSNRFCFTLVSNVYTVGFIGGFVHTRYISSHFFCGANVIHHYFFDILPLLSISCSRDYTKELLVMIVLALNAYACVLAIFSYAFILSSILCIHSAEGRSKAFSTCGAHLAAVGVLYGSIIFMDFKPLSTSATTQEKVASVLYTTVIPMLSPFIYSLRNRDVKEALKKALKSEVISRSV